MTDWTTAACLPHDPTLWDEPAGLPGRGHRDRLTPAASERLAKARVICRQCPIRLDCLTAAVEDADTGVIRGGMTTAERESWRRRQGSPKGVNRRVRDREVGIYGCGTDAGYRRHYRAGESLPRRGNAVRGVQGRAPGRHQGMAGAEGVVVKPYYADEHVTLWHGSTGAKT